MKKKERTRYTDEELQDFKQLIEGKLEEAKRELIHLQHQVKLQQEEEGNHASAIDDGVGTYQLEYLNQLASRQATFIQHLENALLRIENKVYGICRVTGKLIPKERLRAVPHATLSIEAKQKG